METKIYPNFKFILLTVLLSSSNFCVIDFVLDHLFRGEAYIARPFSSYLPNVQKICVCARVWYKNTVWAIPQPT